MEEKDRRTNPIEAGLPDTLKLKRSGTSAAGNQEEQGVQGHALFMKKS
jgi:hypothetical protein